MKQISILMCLIWICSYSVFAASTNESEKALNQKIQELQNNQVKYENNLRQLQVSNTSAIKQINELKSANSSLTLLVDSLRNECEELGNTQRNDRQTLSGKIETTNQSVQTNESVLKNRTWWGAGIAVLLLCLFAGLVGIANTLRKKIKRGSSSIDEVRKAQNALQEESVKLDSKLLELAENQMSSQQPHNSSQASTNNEIDHSLALKVADEIVRIELNLSRMDPSVKGHKQLSKAVERIKNNFLAQGYEIVDMLGKPYNDGMKAVASYVTDDSLPEGEQIITGITKPQINYRGVMIQTAQVTVSQNI